MIMHMGSQFSEHDPMQYEAAMIRGLGSDYRRGRWQRILIRIGGGIVTLGALATAAAYFWMSLQH
jgi:hypothetical protein